MRHQNGGCVVLYGCDGETRSVHDIQAVCSCTFRLVSTTDWLGFTPIMQVPTADTGAGAGTKSSIGAASSIAFRSGGIASLIRSCRAGV